MNEETPSTLPAVAASLLRHGLTFVGGFLVAKGVITADQSAELVPAMLVVVAAGWGIIQKVNARKALKAAIAAPAGRAS